MALDVSEHDRQVGMERAEFLRLVSKRLEATGETEPVAVAEVAAGEAGRFPILSTAGKKGKSALTIYNYRSWKRQLRQALEHVAPEVALVPRYHRGKRAQTADAQHPFILMVARYYETEQRMSLKHSVLVAKAQAKAAHMPKNQILSYSQVHYYYDKVKDRNALMLARQGKEWFANKRCGYIERDWSDVAPGECWIGDHHVFDAPCRIWDADKSAWVPVRPWLTAWMDARSLFMVGWLIRAGEYPDGMAIADSMLNGIRAADYVPPNVAYTDNGKDYCARGFAEPFVSDDNTEHSVLASLGCDPRRALPYNARAKTVERMFRDVAGQFAKWWPGYLGCQPKDRPEGGERCWNEPEELPSLQQFTEAWQFWLQEFYHATPGSSKINGGKAPADVWAARKPLRQPMTHEQLHFAFLHPQGMRVVGRGGRIRIHGQHYQSEALWPRIGSKVMVKVDRFNPHRIFTFTSDGRLLAECSKVETIPALASTDEDRDRISQAMADNRRLLTHARAIQRDDHGGERVMPAAIDRLAMELPGVMPSRIEDGARKAEIEEAAQGACKPPADPQQDVFNSVSDDDLAAFHQSVADKTKPTPAPSDVDDLDAFRNAMGTVQIDSIED